VSNTTSRRAQQKIPNVVNSTLRQSTNQTDPNQRALLDFYGFFDQLFQLTNCSKQPRARAAWHLLYQKIGSNPTQLLAGFIFGIRTPRNCFGDHFH